jgi:HK97 family phage major capsid protein
MFDIKTAREEMARIHADATSHVEKFAKDDAKPTDDEAKGQDARFARLEKLAADVDAAEKLAKFAFSGEQKVSAKIVKDVKHPDQIVAETPAIADISREGYAKALSSWARGDDAEDYATITVSGNSSIVPKVVSQPITPVKTNVYRRAYAAMGLKPESYGNTAPAVTPVITSSAGGLIPEGTQNTSNDASPTIETITLNAHGYQSSTFWYSNEMINAQSWDVTTSTLPALQGARDYGFSKAITAALKADSGITQTSTTASTTTVVIDNLDALNQSFGMLYDSNKVIILSVTAYNLFERLKDSQGFPLLQRNDVQGEHFLAYKGTPVYKDDTLDAMGTSGNVVGIAISMNGFRMRDELEKLIKYVDSPTFVDQTGLNDVGYHGFGYVVEAVAKLLN